MRFRINKWLTFIGFCFNTYANGLCFGIFNVYISTFALYYNLTQQFIQTSFFIGLIVQIVLCIPAMKLLEWRLDYSIWAGSFITTTSYWLMYLANREYILVFAAFTLISVGQATFLPTGFFLSDRWFLLEERSFTIGASFYMNLLGFVSGTILTATYVKTNQQRIKILYLILGIISSISFIIGLFFVRNKPKNLVEQQSQKISLINIKFLWRYKFLTYGMIMTSVFLGVSWSFLSIFCDSLPFSDQQQILLIIIWIISGVFFGILMSFGVNKWVQKTGNFGYYDLFGKIVLLIGILGYFIMAISFQLQIYNFGLFIFLMIMIGIGSIGFYGLMYLSLLETLHPLPPLIIGTIISAFASVYSALIDGLIIFINESYYYCYIMAITSILPWLYLVLTYKTRVKRYKYYLNEKQSKFQLLKVQNQVYVIDDQQSKDK